MGIYDRDYQRDSYGRHEYFMSGGPFSHLPPATRWILIINIFVFMLSIIPGLRIWIIASCSVLPSSYVMIAQIWRLITYQFLHGDPLHIFFNMLVLYYLGPLFEGLWATKTFLRFYLISGAAGGLVYTILVMTGILPPIPLIGASGAIYGLIAAYAILYPHNTVYWFFIFPMRTMTLLFLSVVMSVLFILSGQNAGGEAAHLTGIAVGLFYVYIRPRMIFIRMERSKGSWRRKLEQQKKFEVEVDRILDKIHQSGIGSLTNREREILKEASRREQEEAAKSR